MSQPCSACRGKRIIVVDTTHPSQPYWNAGDMVTAACPLCVGASSETTLEPEELTFRLAGTIDLLASRTHEHRDDVKRVVCEFFLRQWRVPNAAEVLQWRHNEREGRITVSALPKKCRQCGGEIESEIESEKRQKFCSPFCRRAYKRERNNTDAATT